MRHGPGQQTRERKVGTGDGSANQKTFRQLQLPRPLGFGCNLHSDDRRPTNGERSRLPNDYKSFLANFRQVDEISQP